MDTFEGSTLYGPTLVMAGLGSLKSQIGEYERNPGPVSSGLAGAVQGGIVTTIGFGLGYAAGLAS